MRQKSAIPDLQLAGIAAQQHGVVSTRQLLAAGLTGSGIARRVRGGRLHRVHRGVYALGCLNPSQHQEWTAALLACGRKGGAGAVLDHWGAALSHRSAAMLWELLPPGKGLVDVSIPGSGGRKRQKGIRLHRSPGLLSAQVTLRIGIPVTTPARTIGDLRRASSGPKSLISPRELQSAIRQADVLGLALGDDLERDRTRSDLERAFLRLCRRRRVPAPEVNVRIGTHLVDFLWRDLHLAVETDGYRYHQGRVAFEDDRARDLDLRARGIEVIRLADKQIADAPERVANVLAAEIERRTRRNHSLGRRHVAP